MGDFNLFSLGKPRGSTRFPYAIITSCIPAAVAALVVAGAVGKGWMCRAVATLDIQANILLRSTVIRSLFFLARFFGGPNVIFSISVVALDV